VNGAFNRYEFIAEKFAFTLPSSSAATVLRTLGSGNPAICDDPLRDRSQTRERSIPCNGAKFGPFAPFCVSGDGGFDRCERRICYPSRLHSRDAVVARAAWVCFVPGRLEASER
jgi:hypothetical protein